MKYQALAVLAALGSVVAQGVTDRIAPPVPAPPGCRPSVNGKFEIAIVELGNKVKRDLLVNVQKRAPACSGSGILVTTLQDGVIKDAQGRTGYIASNYQFQFDGPPQAGSIYTAGFSECSNGSLALGGSTVFYQCKSGNFYNLYDRWWAEQCSPVEILAMPCGDGADEVGGQRVVGTSVVTTTAVVPLGDGQPQVVTTTKAIPMCQIDDGQIQGHTTPCAAITPAATTAPPVSQFSDGQIQVPPTVQGSIVPSPSAAGVPNGTTMRTSVPPPPPSVLPTNAPPTSSAGRFRLGSASALVVGLVAAVWLHLASTFSHLPKPQQPPNMSEYWKSTPKYWCKHCGVFVRDTKLERTNHEATGKHQGAIKRSLRDIHRNAEQQERDKERAKREIDRLNGVVSSSSASTKGSASGAKSSYAAAPQQVTEAERQKQLEQLAELGVNIPTELRGSMAMVGEWTVTSTRVIKGEGETEEEKKGEVVPGRARATGVKRERERTEEEKEQEEAIKGLFGKRPRWGVGSRQMPAEEDAELDALLSGPLVKTKKEEEEVEDKVGVKKEEVEDSASGGGEAAGGDDSTPQIKKEPSEGDAGVPTSGAPGEAVPDGSPPTVMFKKRKAKTVRQR
ncbi:hypothetical protein QBC34DRAFT_451898 [Podospora aff. communis PSN243]|uniref:U1-type domain-containing protein n=1 Tax=Podospora aff. communis PSN243 TaxID=3040156 RepID=A0AAV9G8K7_9PEZI|nr:hypothetical protein QBC34DRAFT_451898 [Podospora aff. communis PSN243]